MRRIKNGDRRMVMEHYLSLERRKRDDLPVDLPVLDFDDPNELDDWLLSHVLKVGVVSGFKRWVLVELEPQEIRECAVVADIAQKIAGQGASQNLGVLEKAPGLKSWTPTDPGHYWDGRLGTGAGLPVDQAVILRPALPSPPSDEYSRFYIEDGSGRITQLVQRSDQTERVFAYIGLQPDWRSVWLSNEWGGHFVLNHDMYDKDDDVLGAPGTRSDES